MNFSDFKAVETTNKRTGLTTKRSQTFNFRFRKYMSKVKDTQVVEEFFHISDKLFAKYQLEERALRQLLSPEGKTFLIVVDEENATLMKRSVNKDGTAQGKGRKFKSSIVSEDLAKDGIINLDIIGEAQLLDLKEVATDVTIGSGEKAFVAYHVLEVVKGEAQEGEAEDEDEDEVLNANGTVDAPAQIEADAHEGEAFNEAYESDEF